MGVERSIADTFDVLDPGGFSFHSVLSILLWRYIP
jgi:hypothetical protein